MIDVKDTHKNNMKSNSPEVRTYISDRPTAVNPVEDELRRAMSERVLLLDGAMGTMIQRCGLTEDDFRSASVKPTVDKAQRGCNDVLCLTRPDVITGIHTEYIAAGADIIETNTFNANRFSLADYGLAHEVGRICREGARLARAAADAAGRRVWVAGSVGPSGKSLTMTRQLDGADAVSWDEMEDAFTEQIQALVEGGADIILLETIFDTLNAKAAIRAADRAFEAAGKRLPLMLSVTLTESGRTLSGQTPDAFVASIAHANPLTVGFNCGFGPDRMGHWVEALQSTPFAISLHPNAGLPDEMGRYMATPSIMAEGIEPMLRKGWLNIIGGCCGTTPAHIAALAEVARGASPRVAPAPDGRLHLAGLEPLCRTGQFMPVGERCNVAGSRKFLKLIAAGETAEALTVATAQIEKGAAVIDINMDDAMLDARAEMCRFLELISTEPAIARVPVMIDSSDWRVVEAALKLVQGKPIVNSISLKEGEEEFVRRARHIHSMGAAMVVMAFDEVGQTDTFERKCEVCARAYRLLTAAGIPAEDIIFDPNVLAVATGIAEHSRYGLDFIRATGWIKENLPGAAVSGGVSNLSFSFRGNNPVREALHAEFLERCAALGMDMAIVNPATRVATCDIPGDLREAIVDVLLDRHPEATERLIEVATKYMPPKKDRPAAGTAPSVKPSAGAEEKPADRISRLVIAGSESGLEDALRAEMERTGAFAVVEGPLMAGMNRVGELFGRGEMFLPQVVKSARTMQRAVAFLTPYIESEKKGERTAAGHMVIATVKGDVHDIGKNIVDVVMNCNSFEMTDLGVMVPPEKIVDTAVETGAGFVGLSGLITPSLTEMCNVATMMEERGLKIPLFVGGAAASELHTAVKIAPCYSGPVVYTRDAASLPGEARRFGDPATRPEAEAELRRRQQQLRDAHAERTSLTQTDALARRHRFIITEQAPAPRHQGEHTLHPTVADVRGIINWRAFFSAWGMDASMASIAAVEGCDHCRAQWLAAAPQEKRMQAARAMQLHKEASRLLDSLERRGAALTARVVILPARGTDDAIIFRKPDGSELTLPTPRQRHTGDDGERLALCDFVNPDGTDHTALFAVTTRGAITDAIAAARAEADDYTAMLLQTLADRLAEAATEWLHARVRRDLWGYEHSDAPVHHLDSDYAGIRPAIGYPSLPDQSLVFTADSLLRYGDIGIKLTENGALDPVASTTGLIIGYGAARYFIIK